MNDQQYLEHCRRTLVDFSKHLAKRTDGLADEDSLKVLADDFSALASGERDLYVEGPQLVSRLFTTFPDLAPDFPRELLWFLGGECLHYMPDEEIAVYQRLDQLRAAASHSGEIIDFQAVRAKLLKTK